MSDRAKILIAEDEKPIAKALSLKLEHAGYEVMVVGDGRQAIDQLEKGGFALVLMDLIMPNLDGFGALEEIKNKGINVPIIVLSNLSQEDDLKKVKELGAKGYFVKSNTPLAEVVTQVGEMLRK